MNPNTPASLVGKPSWGAYINKYASILALVASFAFFTILMPDMFLTFSNMVTILRSISTTTVLAIGLTVTMVVDGFDISIGAVATLSGAFIISFFVWYNMNFWLAMLLTVVLTMAVTMLTAAMVVKFKIPELLASLAVMFTVDGLSLTYSGGGALSQGMPRPDGTNSYGIIPEIFKDMGQAPTIIIIMLLSIVAVHIFLKYTKYGRYMYATGGNREAARLSGVPVNRYRVLAGLITGLFVALGGMLVASRNMSAQILGADGYIMPAIAAVFIGESVMGERKPNAFGTFIGAALVGILENGLVMMSVPYYALDAIKGIVLALALASTYISNKD